MHRFHRKCRTLAMLALFGLFILFPEHGHGETTDTPWSIFAYGGQWTETRFVHIIRGRTEFHRSHVWVLGGSRTLFDFSNHLGTEGEVNIAGHTGLQHHAEVNGAFILRWRTFPWDRYVDTSFAYGLGLSWASEQPPIEEEPRRSASRLLLFTPAELTFAPPKIHNSPWEAMVRIHHRSGAFGWFKDAGGSNFLSVGVRRRF